MSVPIPNSQHQRLAARNFPSPARAGGFTLIEILTAVGIILLVAVLAVPSYQAAMDLAKRARCSGHMRQIGTAFASYLGDHNHILPQRYYSSVSIGYDDLLASYAEDISVFLCPGKDNKKFPGQPSYGMNWYYDNVSSALVEKPTETILAAEASLNGSGGSHRADRDSHAPGELDPLRHRGKANYLFFDGHVRLMSFEETLYPVDLWGTDQGKHNAVPPELPIAG